MKDLITRLFEGIVNAVQGTHDDCNDIVGDETFYVAEVKFDEGINANAFVVHAHDKKSDESPKGPIRRFIVSIEEME